MQSLLDLEISGAQKFNTSRSFPLWPLAREELNPLASKVEKKKAPTEKALTSAVPKS